jgi:hypothetical protein
VQVSDRLSPLDVSFLYLEERTTPMHVGSVMIFRPGPGGLDYPRLLRHVEGRIALVPRYRQRVRFVPGRIANPVWVDDERFDITYHVRRSALPRPGSQDQLEELVARVQALGRRATPAAPPLLVAGDVELDPARRTVHRANRPIELTRKEFGVLEVLMGAGGAVVSSEELLERVWDENADPFTTTVRVTVMTLRKKLGEPGIIDTVVGSGYRVPVEAPATV